MAEGDRDWNLSRAVRILGLPPQVLTPALDRSRSPSASCNELDAHCAFPRFRLSTRKLLLFFQCKKMLCCIPKCPNENGKGKKCYVARFPWDPLRFQQWLDNILRNHDSLPVDWIPTSDSRVCEVIIFKKLSKTRKLVSYCLKYHKLMPSFHSYASCLAIYITLYFIIVFRNFEKFIVR